MLLLVDLEGYGCHAHTVYHKLPTAISDAAVLFLPGLRREV